jgi:hypothetical protein
MNKYLRKRSVERYPKAERITPWIENKGLGCGKIAECRGNTIPKYT